eukprot:12090898-Alexandrium_andersonii.AAC.1
MQAWYIRSFCARGILEERQSGRRSAKAEVAEATRLATSSSYPPVEEMMTPRYLTEPALGT